MMRSSKVRFAPAFLALVIGTAACASPQTTSDPALDIDQQVSIARKGLATRLGVKPDEIFVAAARVVHWQSGAIGCPKPGMNYTMAIVPGVQILLKHDDVIYRYHAERHRHPFFCPADRAEAPAFGQGEEAM